MNTPRTSEALFARKAASKIPEMVTTEWCDLHRLIEQLTAIQRRLGTPLEQPDDFVRVRGIGSDIREKLDHISPWVVEQFVETSD